VHHFAVRFAVIKRQGNHPGCDMAAIGRFHYPQLGTWVARPVAKRSFKTGVILDNLRGSEKRCQTKQ
jgi:hypothetical protein